MTDSPTRGRSARPHIHEGLPIEGGTLYPGRLSQKSRARTPLELLTAARELAPRLVRASPTIRAKRTIPAPILGALRNRGLLDMWVPRVLGGSEVDFVTNLRVIEELSAANASVGWCVMIMTGTSCYVNAYANHEVADEIYGDPEGIAVGFVAALGAAHQAKTGLRVRGLWPFASGSDHATWIASGVSARLADGTSQFRTILLPRERYTFLDTWHSLGLEGTGSHHYSLESTFVPQRYTFSMDKPPSAREGALYRVQDLFLANMPGVPLGAARAAIEYAQGHVTPRLRQPLARAVATVGAARAYVEATLSEMWEVLEQDPTLPGTLHGRYRLALAQAFEASAHAIELLFTAFGARAVYDSIPLQGHLRDIQTMRQHAQVGFDLASELWLERAAYPRGSPGTGTLV